MIRSIELTMVLLRSHINSAFIMIHSQYTHIVLLLMPEKHNARRLLRHRTST